jgi:hypothetical protein
MNRYDVHASERQAAATMKKKTLPPKLLSDPPRSKRIHGNAEKRGASGQFRVVNTYRLG